MTASENIKANVGSVDSLEYQTNGTERLKGSSPHLLTSATQISAHLRSAIPNALRQSAGRPTSRLSSRYFVTGGAIAGLDQIDGTYEHLECSVEAKIELGNIFKEQGIDEDIWWVWVGGNDRGRRLVGDLRDKLSGKFARSVSYFSGQVFELPARYEIVRTIDHKDAEQIAAMYHERMPVYVAPNHDPDFILNTVATSPETELFALRDLEKGDIVACASNEFCSYPVQLPSGSKSEVVICESNDWVKRKEVPREVFMSVVGTSLTSAIHHGVHAIEAECVPESFRIASSLGYTPEGLLERTSHMVTDGKNVELHDSETPEPFRKFNSLWLYTMTSGSPAWEQWKNH